MSIITGAVLIVSLLMVLYAGVRKADAMETVRRQREEELAQERILEHSLARSTDAIRRYRHDLGGFLLTLEHMLSEERTEAADSAGEQAGKMSFPMAIVQRKRQECENQGIGFSFKILREDGGTGQLTGVQKIDTFPASAISEEDLASLLQNLLDNAMEANLRLPEGKNREIEAELTMGHEFELVIRNRAVVSENMEFRTGKEDPQLHGIGLQVIREIVQKYHGDMYMEADPEQGWVTTRIRIPASPSAWN